MSLLSKLIDHLGIDHLIDHLGIDHLFEFLKTDEGKQLIDDVQKFFGNKGLMALFLSVLSKNGIKVTSGEFGALQSVVDVMEDIANGADPASLAVARGKELLADPDFKLNLIKDFTVGEVTADEAAILADETIEKLTAMLDAVK